MKTTSKPVHRISSALASLQCFQQRTPKNKEIQGPFNQKDKVRTCPISYAALEPATGSYVLIPVFAIHSSSNINWRFHHNIKIINHRAENNIITLNIDATVRIRSSKGPGCSHMREATPMSQRRSSISSGHSLVQRLPIRRQRDSLRFLTFSDFRLFLLPSTDKYKRDLHSVCNSLFAISHRNRLFFITPICHWSAYFPSLNCEVSH